MSTIPQKISASRFRPRFSVRTLAIFVTLVCVYFGAWPLTKKYGVVKMEGRGWVVFEVAGFPFKPEEQYAPSTEYVDSPAPFILRAVHIKGRGEGIVFQRYYLWLVVTTVQLPFERDIEFSELQRLVRYDVSESTSR